MISNLKTPIFDRIPAVYDLSLTPDGTGLVTHIHPAVVNVLISPNGFYQGNVMERDLGEYGLNSFTRPTAPDKAWGFHDSLQPCASSRGWPAWVTQLPKIRTPDNQGETSEADRVAMRVSLSNLFRWLSIHISETPTDSTNEQLLVITDISLPSGRGCHDGSVFVDFTPAATDWMRLCDESLLKQVGVSMAAAYDYMLCSRCDRNADRFQAYFNGRPRLMIDIPGGGSGMGPTCGTNPAEGEGFEFAPNNLDSDAQQWTVLFGLARLCMLMRDTIS